MHFSYNYDIQLNVSFSTFAHELSKASKEKGMEMTNTPAKFDYIRHDEDLEMWSDYFKKRLMIFNY